MLGPAWLMTPGLGPSGSLASLLVPAPLPRSPIPTRGQPLQASRWSDWVTSPLLPRAVQGRTAVAGGPQGCSTRFTAQDGARALGPAPDGFLPHRTSHPHPRGTAVCCQRPLCELCPSVSPAACQLSRACGSKPLNYLFQNTNVTSRNDLKALCTANKSQRCQCAHSGGRPEERGHPSHRVGCGPAALGPGTCRRRRQPLQTPDSGCPKSVRVPSPAGGSWRGNRSPREGLASPRCACACSGDAGQWAGWLAFTESLGGRPRGVQDGGTRLRDPLGPASVLNK